MKVIETCPHKDGGQSQLYASETRHDCLCYLSGSWCAVCTSCLICLLSVDNACFPAVRPCTGISQQEYVPLLGYCLCLLQAEGVPSAACCLELCAVVAAWLPSEVSA